MGLGRTPGPICSIRKVGELDHCHPILNYRSLALNRFLTYEPHELNEPHELHEPHELNELHQPATRIYSNVFGRFSKRYRKKSIIPSFANSASISV